MMCLFEENPLMKKCGTTLERGRNVTWGWLESCLKQVLFLVSGRDDIREVVDRLIFDDDKHLTREEKVRVVENVLRECDNDEDGALCFPEFQQAMAKSPDFIQLFKMYI